MAPVSSAVEWLPSTVDERAMFDELRDKVNAGVAWLQSHFPDLKIESEVVDGVPVDAIVAESESARLTVVDARARDPHDRVLRRRVAELVAHSLLEELDDAA